VRASILISVLFWVACGATRPPASDSGSQTAGEEPAFELRHRIIAEYGSETQIFEGVMILQGQGFLVRAFAWPGLGLFTVARNGESHDERAHLPGLEGRLDLDAVGMDITRTFLGGCDPPLDGGDVECLLLGQVMVEVYDEGGRRLSRLFPDAYEGGFRVSYRDHAMRFDRWWALEIELEFGDSGNGMVFRQLSVRETEPVDMASSVAADGT
jgi:hypothetical protein